MQQEKKRRRRTTNTRFQTISLKVEYTTHYKTYEISKYQYMLIGHTESGYHNVEDEAMELLR